MSYFHIKGVLPPMITPFKENGDVDYEKHIENMKKWNEADLAGYLVLGSNSETVYLSEEEKLKLIELTVKYNSKNRIVLVGTGLESTKATIKLTNKAADLGADAALILTPHYYCSKMTDDALINYYTEVADSTKIPILIYNVTKFTHVDISPYAVGKLSRHQNIIGMKDSSGNISKLVEFMRAVDKDFNLLVGTASVWYPALTLGIKGSIMALGNCCPNECALIQKYFDEGDFEKSKELYLRMYPVNQAVTTIYGIAGLKYACDKLGFQGGFTRKPLLNLKKKDKESIEAILKEAKVL